MDERTAVSSTVKGAEKDKKLDKVVTGSVKIKKKGKAAKLASLFFVEDVKSVVSYVGMQILLPAMKKMFIDMVNSAANSLVNGLGSYTGTTKKSAITSNISYRPWLEARDPNRDSSRPTYAPNNAIYDCGDIIFDTKDEIENKDQAKKLVDTMEEIIDRYNEVTVADLYQLVGWVPNSSDYDWGWKNLRDTQYIRLDDGRYLVRFPRVRPISK